MRNTVQVRQWEEQDVWLEKAWHALLATLHRDQLLVRDETFLDSSFMSAKKGQATAVRTSAFLVCGGRIVTKNSVGS